MWGDPRSASRPGPFRGNPEERCIPNWNRDFLTIPKSHINERPVGRDLLFSFPGQSRFPVPHFTPREKTVFGFGAQDGSRAGFRAEMLEQAFHGRDFPSSNFQGRDAQLLHFRSREMSRPEFIDRENHPMDFLNREELHMDYRKRDAASFDYRNRVLHAAEIRGRQVSSLGYGERESLSDFRSRGIPPSDFRDRGTCDLDLRGRDHPQLDMGPINYRGQDHSQSNLTTFLDLLDKDGAQTSYEGQGISDLDLRERDSTSLDFDDREKPKSDQDFREWDISAAVDFAKNLVPPPNTSLLEFLRTLSAVRLPDQELPGGSTDETERRVRDPSSESPSFKHHELRGSGQSQGLLKPEEPSHNFRNNQGHLTNQQDSNKVSTDVASMQQAPAGESNRMQPSPGHKRVAELDFLGRQDTDYRNMEYCDVDLRFDYGHGKTLPSGRTTKDSLQDKDYRRNANDETASKFVRLEGVPAAATKEEILGAFQAPDGTPLQSLRLTSSKSGYSHGSVCVEFSLLEEAIGCMEANQGCITICGTKVPLHYSSGPDDWCCHQCETINVGFEELCSKCNTSREKLEETSDERTQKAPQDLPAVSSSVTQKEKEVVSPPAPPPRSLQEPSHPSESPADPKQGQKEEAEKQQSPKAPRKYTDKGLRRREGQNRSKREAEKKHQHGEDMQQEIESRSEQIGEAERENQMDSESKSEQNLQGKGAMKSKTVVRECETIMVKNFLVGTTPEIIVKTLEPYVHLSTSRVRIIKNKAMRFGTTYGFIEMDSHEEALRVIHLLQMLDPPLSIDGQTLSVNLAVGRRREDSSSYQPGHSENSSHGKGKKREGASRGRHTSGEASRQSEHPSSDGSSYIYDSELGVYYDPLSGMYYDPKSQKEVPLGEKSPSESTGKLNESQSGSRKEKKSFPKETSRERRERRQNRNRTREPLSPKRPRGIARRARTASSEREEPGLRRRERKEPRRSSRTFSENKNSSGKRKSDGEDLFKKPLPPVLMKKEEPPEMPKVNPLIGLIGEYGGDSDSEEEEEQKKVVKPQPAAPQPKPKPKTMEGAEDKLTDWSKLACLLCRRQFPNKEGLIRHQQLSDLHKQNMAIHMKIKQSEKELAYLERKEKEVECKEQGAERKGKSMTLVSPERKRLKHTKDASGNRELMSTVDTDSNEKKSQELLRDSTAKSARSCRWKGGRKEAGLAAQGKTQKRPANESYRDAVRKAMFALYKDLE
ncbi:LOW QUALITY PROTEIN: RNA-binding protein 6 [Microcaecilia unicolor]|uniref:LOW QUALITY PROTEIN: RNA-binding protein 6 n=1 Tax=Microcaecilia unicolor TaxID=1415580 RepID=A0A6P7Y163_9AMPH|nr:LOW QUALITY PROTEIN: RNA-binding protein 6 [Microcaecilia unicolor]